MYGESIGVLRIELAHLLGQYHVSHRIDRDLARAYSGPGVVDTRGEVVALIRSFRHSVLTWCYQAMVHGDPNPKAEHSANLLEPPDRLRQSLGRVVAKNPAPLPRLEQLTTHQPVAVLESWRQAAKTTAIAEHDLAHGTGDGRLSHREWLTLVGDVADITRALLILDKRYRHVSEWETLRGLRLLDGYLDDCVVHVCERSGKLDSNLDWRGWQPLDPEVSPNAEPIVHVIAAERRLLNSLGSVPSMANLRHLMTSQREVSHLAALRTGDHDRELANRFHRREHAYGSLLRASRTAAGLLGTGAEATRHSADAVDRLVSISAVSPIPLGSLHELDTLFRQVDNALCAAIEEGFSARLYFVRRALPRIDPTDGHLTHQARELFDPLQCKGHTPLITIARRYLRTNPVRTAAPSITAMTRADFHAAINQRRSRGSAISL
ncbi:hypothetical protein ABTX24_26345 [Nocardioides sp. NPDC127514]